MTDIWQRHPSLPAALAHHRDTPCLPRPAALCPAAIVSLGSRKDMWTLPAFSRTLQLEPKQDSTRRAGRQVESRADTARPRTTTTKRCTLRPAFSLYSETDLSRQRLFPAAIKTWRCTGVINSGQIAR
ncbi:hypothetical protein E2C01_085180 [Portunus trituberculatus]|uniref:Uncharacterized protein n=1 Tax=Portunus trituberculatus TaxID=210409 RepID=A0A5B7J850_PORTR|nr:hypothetical protein [Portunus trituberculatus]